MNRFRCCFLPARRASAPVPSARSGHVTRGVRLLLLLAALAAAPAGPVQAAWEPEGVDLARPRLLFRAGDLAEIRARLDRDPYRTLFLRLMARADEAASVPLDDPSLDAHRRKARAAKNLAFAYALDRTVVGNAIVPFPSAAAREAVGDRVRDLLANLYPRSRMAVPPPLGDWDRDISSSEELLQYATAYDTLLGAGYDLGADREVVVERLTDLAAELYLNYIEPETGLPFLIFHGAEAHQNNHRAKVGAALVAAGVALAEETPPPGDPRGLREPTNWVEYGLDQMDLVVRHVLTAGDGAYAEGLHYQAFAAQNLHPLLRAWDRLVDGRTWHARGLELPSLWRHPLFRRSQRFALDFTLPNGALAPFDDASVDGSYPFGTAPRPEDPAWAAAFAWRWARAPWTWEASGNVDLAADAIVNHVDDVVPAPPPGSPSAFYLEGGAAALRSDWSEDGVVSVVLGEYDTASEFGRDRQGLGVGPQSHEHAEPGSFTLHAFGERLLLDPGMVEFSIANPLQMAPAHNTILVNGAGPGSFLLATVQWIGSPDRPPIDGQGVLHEPLDGDALDAVSVVTRYGLPDVAGTEIRRRFHFPDHRYLVVADRVDSQLAEPELTWLLHGHGGASSGGSFEPTAVGGRWSRPGARVDTGVAVAGHEPQLDTATAEHEAPGRARREHVVLRAHVQAESARALHVLYPTPASSAPPVLRRLDLPGAAALALEDAEEDRLAAVAFREPAAGPLALPAGGTGLAPAETDGTLLGVDGRADGSLRVAWAEDATRLRYDGALRLGGVTPGTLVVAPETGRLHVVADNADAVVEVPALPFEPVAADGACALHQRGERVFVELGRERRFTLRAAGAGSRPAADPGADRRVAVGSVVELDGTASCDADGGTPSALSPEWELVSAPPGSDWVLEDAASFRPRLLADRPGPFRVRLVVRDASGQASRPVEVRILAGETCADGFDDDFDARIDGDDPDCDGADSAPLPPTAAGDAYTVDADAPFEPAPDAGVLANDSDPEGEPVGAVLEQPPAHGELLLLADGHFFYEPVPDFAGRDRFTYRARDAGGLESAPVVVELEVVARDSVSLFLWRDGATWQARGPLDGGVGLARDRHGRLRRVRAEGRVGEKEASLALDFRRLLPGLFWGGFELRDPGLAAGRAEGFGLALVTPQGADRAQGWMLSLARPPFLFAFDVHDRP